MTYSAAWFASPGDDARRRAQLRKIDGILDLAGVGPGSGCWRSAPAGAGWPSAAAQRGAHVTTLTLSAEQTALAERRIAEAGLADRIDVRLQDYRERRRAPYDAIVSVEMIEAVGERYWPTYFAALDRLLAPGGRIGLQAITMAHDRLLATRNDYTWVHKYVFPGGALPSVQAIERGPGRGTRSCAWPSSTRFGAHYAQTLRLWRRTVQRARRRGRAALGFDETFRRMWKLLPGLLRGRLRAPATSTSTSSSWRRPR